MVIIPDDSDMVFVCFCVGTGCPKQMHHDSPSPSSHVVPVLGKLRVADQVTLPGESEGGLGNMVLSAIGWPRPAGGVEIVR